MELVIEHWRLGTVTDMVSAPKDVELWVQIAAADVGKQNNNNESSVANKVKNAAFRFSPGLRYEGQAPLQRNRTLHPAQALQLPD